MIEQKRGGGRGADSRARARGPAIRSLRDTLYAPTAVTVVLRLTSSTELVRRLADGLTSLLLFPHSARHDATIDRMTFFFFMLSVTQLKWCVTR